MKVEKEMIVYGVTRDFGGDNIAIVSVNIDKEKVVESLDSKWDTLVEMTISKVYKLDRKLTEI